MEILIILLTGLAVGIVAKFLMPGNDPGGFLITMLLGIAGAFVGGLATSMMGLGAMGGLSNFVAAVIGAMLLLGAYRLIRSRT